MPRHEPATGSQDAKGFKVVFPSRVGLGSHRIEHQLLLSPCEHTGTNDRPGRQVARESADLKTLRFRRALIDALACVPSEIETVLSRSRAERLARKGIDLRVKKVRGKTSRRLRAARWREWHSTVPEYRPAEATIFRPSDEPYQQPATETRNPEPAEQTSAKQLRDACGPDLP